MNELENDQNTSIAYDPLTKRKDTIEPSEPRRSQRTRKEKYLDSDFISPDQITFLVEGNRDRILRKMKILLNIEDEPKTLSEALASRDSAFWQEAVNDEIDSIMSNNTWILVDLPPG